MDPPSQHAVSTIDPKLVARVVKGDHQAFSHLYDQSSTLLYSLALRILGSREEAAELLQEVYLGRTEAPGHSKGTQIKSYASLSAGR
jgi:RNA polymerase sigma-70 factor (ECF subfamily)